MDATAPDFATHWNARTADEHGADDERRTVGEDQALAELADRILAARSIV
ncbi:MAG: hypothetical protein ABI585_02435 [Betaproteobacteria bacterium]